MLEKTSREEEATKAMMAVLFERFYADEVGREYGFGRSEKDALLESFRRIEIGIPSATSWILHALLAQEILSIPKDAPGSVIECGCWKGASTASLSLVCKAVGRKLIVCDSFEGLPEDGPDMTHVYPHLKFTSYYQKGMYAGRLDEVKNNIERYGDVSVCEFVPGFFSDTLHSLTGPIAFAFLDVDLVSSIRDCLKYIWPLLIEGGAVYGDDSCDMEIVRVWFDDEWWRREVGVRAPGYVGSGCGIPIGPTYSSLGYSRKLGEGGQGYDGAAWPLLPGGAIPQEAEVVGHENAHND